MDMSVDNDMDDEPTNSDLAYAVRIVHAACCLAGSASYLADLREGLRDDGIIRAFTFMIVPLSV